MSEFSDKIKDWVHIDNKVKTLFEEIKKLRSSRNQLTTHIFDYATEHNLEHAVIQISDGKLKFQQTRVPQSLTLTFIKECLTDCINNQTQVEQIIDYIKQKRNIKYSNDIKRFYS